MQKNRTSITALAATVSHLFGIEPPGIAKSPPLSTVLDNASTVLHGEPIDRCLIFSPDALGAHLSVECEEEFARVRGICPLKIPMRSIVPPKTPVCFASMFTGAQPAEHGIQQYEKPVLQCDTLFDALIRTGRKPAIVTVRDSSMDFIFREREMAYFSEEYDPDTTRKTLELLRENTMDLIVCYQQEYDDLLHRTQPFSYEALLAVSNHIRSFGELAETAREAWSDHNYALIFAPDHGAHANPVSGRGTHGEDIPDDMELDHWYGIYPRGNEIT